MMYSRQNKIKKTWKLMGYICLDGYWGCPAKRALPQCLPMADKALLAAYPRLSSVGILACMMLVRTHHTVGFGNNIVLYKKILPQHDTSIAGTHARLCTHKRHPYLTLTREVVHWSIWKKGEHFVLDPCFTYEFSNFQCEFSICIVWN